MKINKAEHPAARCMWGEDDKAHVVDSFGDPWCEDEIELDGEAAFPTIATDWCEGCMAVAIGEGLVTP